MSVEDRGDRFRELEEAYRDYTVYDQHYERIGRVDDLFVDERDQPEYIGVKTGFLGMKSTLIPMELARVNDRRRLIEVAADKHTITEGPAFDDDEEITPEHEARIYGYYGLQHPGFVEGRGGYGDYYASNRPEGSTGEDLAGYVDTEYGERREESLEQPAPGTPPSEPTQDRPVVAGDAGASADTGEPAQTDDRVQAGAEGQNAASVRIYKRTRTER